MLGLLTEVRAALRARRRPRRDGLALAGLLGLAWSGTPAWAQQPANPPATARTTDDGAQSASRPVGDGSGVPRLGPGQAAVTATVPEASAGRPPFKLLRYDEDFRFLADPARRTDFFDPLKYIPLFGRDRFYLTFGGDVREWFESYHNDSFGEGPGNAEGFNTYFLQRYMLHADLHAGDRLRVFFQTISGFESGRIGGPRPDIDVNRFDAHQGFVDWIWRPEASDSSLTWRLGRQEFRYGSGRLIDVREGPNLRRSFDGARALGHLGPWSIDGWWAKPVLNNPGVFDDIPNPAVMFWGLYGVRPVGDGTLLDVDLYYLGFQNLAASFDGDPGRELRHSIGTRIWGRPLPWEYNLEYVYQFGRFGSGEISAWTAANAARYNFADMPFRPALGVRFDVASGDRDANSANLQTFNPLFPSGAYYNLTGPFGPQNIIDVHPTLDLHAGESLTLSADWAFFWRESLDDGVYRLSGSLIASGRTSRARTIGSSPALTAVWTLNPHTTLLASYVRIFPGQFLKETTPGKDVDYATVWLTFKF
ncbi:alginate export family protein [Aquisphaera insulae]|uniref:alginate export family protein n=1 Tax=Aquisphaera insulae TaxID=2712864 RepID=UPI00202E8EAD|nr:alginate export family protein [Aquisphaera insulae]